MKTLLAALAVAMTILTLFPGGAQARCWWNGHRQVCDGWRGPGPYRGGYYGGGPAWPRYPGWERHRWCYYHPYRCP